MRSVGDSDDVFESCDVNEVFKLIGVGLLGISESGWPNLTGREGILRTEARRRVYSQKTTWDPRFYWRLETEDPPGSWLQRA